jgi:hypothetical protein
LADVYLITCAGDLVNAEFLSCGVSVLGGPEAGSHFIKWILDYTNKFFHLQVGVPAKFSFSGC